MQRTATLTIPAGVSVSGSDLSVIAGSNLNVNGGAICRGPFRSRSIRAAQSQRGWRNHDHQQRVALVSVSFGSSRDAGSAIRHDHRKRLVRSHRRHGQLRRCGTSHHAGPGTDRRHCQRLGGVCLADADIRHQRHARSISKPAPTRASPPPATSTPAGSSSKAAQPSASIR